MNKSNRFRYNDAKAKRAQFNANLRALRSLFKIKGPGKPRFFVIIRETFTIKKCICIVVAAFFSCILRLCYFYFFPNISITDLAFLFPTSLGSILASTIAGLYYDHFSVMGENKIIDKFFMDNTGSNISNNSNGFTNTIAELLNPLVPVTTIRCTHGVRGLTMEKITELNRLGLERQLLSISNVDYTNNSCLVTLYKPVPSVDDVQDAEILKRLYQLFPYGTNYSGRTGAGRLDDYRLTGCVRDKLDNNSNDNLDWPYRANQNKPANIVPIFDPNRPKGYYQPWANDIADRIIQYRKDANVICGKPTLDSESQIFVTTFSNYHHKLNPSKIDRKDALVSCLRDL